MSVPAPSPQGVSIDVPASAVQQGKVQLRGDNLPAGALPPVWQRSGLRARMLLWRALMLLAFCAVVLGSAYGIGTMIRAAVTSVHVPGIVTAQDESGHRGGHCVLDVAFSMNGRQLQGTVDTNTTCKGVPGPGAGVTLNVYPDNPLEYLTVVGHDSQSWTAWPFAVGAIIGSIAAGLFLARSVRVYRRARSLASNDVPWRQLTGTVKRHETTGHGRKLWLEAPDLTGRPHTFCLYPDMGLLFMADARPGNAVTFWLKTDGGHEVLLTENHFPRLRFVTLRGPTA